MPPDYYYEYLFASLAFVFGACIGSFLNVCIYRLPLGLSVNEPKRSFCPSCKNPIAWRHNLPLISWLGLRGKCSYCGAPIAFRYFGVELLTAVLFLTVWLVHPWELALPYWILVSILIVATFIDFEHFIIPDEVTWGGVGAGLLMSLAVPELMGTDSHLLGLAWSALGAVLGYFTLWGVVEAGKLAFGKKRITFDKPAPFLWTRVGDDADVLLDEEKMKWSDLFTRESDRLILKCVKSSISGKEFGETPLTFYYNRVLVGEETFQLDQLETISGSVNEVIIPREAMGFGDVKFIAAIGAFLGWQAVFFTIVSASLIGAVVGVTAIALGKREYSARIPFGPYLALGALIWLFVGPQIIGWYLGFLTPPEPF